MCYTLSAISKSDISPSIGIKNGLRSVENRWTPIVSCVALKVATFLAADIREGVISL